MFVIKTLILEKEVFLLLSYKMTWFLNTYSSKYDEDTLP